MNREEFLDILRQQLEGSVTPDILNSQLSYYRNYIDREIASGKSEEEVLKMLGDPRLIAKTLIETNKIPQPKIRRDRPIDTDYQGDEEEESADSEQQNGSGRHAKDDSRNSGSKKVSRFTLGDLPRILLAILIVLFVVVMIFTLLRAYWPLLIVVVIVIVILYLRRRRRW